MSTSPRITEPTRPAGRGGGLGGSPLTPKTARRIALFGSISLALFGILILRLWFLQVVGASGLEAQASANSVRSINIPAPRGEIRDRNGVPLAQSKLAWDVVALPQDLYEGTGPDAGLTRQGELTLNKLARALDEKPQRLRQLMAIGKKRTPYKSVVLKADIDPEDPLFYAMNERIGEFPGVRLERTQRRSYVDDGLNISHVLGWVGQIPADQAESYRQRGYRNDAIVGINGLEARYQDFLKGTDGERKVEVDASGEPTARGVVSERPAKPGAVLVTSIDYKVQKELSQALRDAVERTSIKGGGGVVMDIRTGEIVAMASYPQINLQDFASAKRGAMTKAINDKREPMFNRAVWAYPPASTFKTITAVAALNSGAITADEPLRSGKYADLFGTRFWNFRKMEQGDMSIQRALRVSSDTFFYQVGAKLINRASKRDQINGHDKLYFWAKSLGFGAPTGITDLIPGESAGVLPDRHWKANNPGLLKASQPTTWDQWRRGDTINMSVGQGELRATPLQMVRAYGALLNGGRLVTPTIGSKIYDANTTTLLSDLRKGQPEKQIPTIRPGVIEPIRAGLYDVANNYEGTGVNTFGRLGGLVAGKTGTAESGQERDHAWFVGYAPADKPEYAVAVVIEYSGLGGQVAAPVACKAITVAVNVDPENCGSGAPPAGSGD